MNRGCFVDVVAQCEGGIRAVGIFTIETKPGDDDNDKQENNVTRKQGQTKMSLALTSFSRMKDIFHSKQEFHYHGCGSRRL